MQSSEKTETSEGARSQAVFIRRSTEVVPMSWGQRIGLRICDLMPSFGYTGAEETPGGDVESAMEPAVQYRLEATRRLPHQGFKQRLLTCGGLCGRSHLSASLTVGVHPNQKVTMYLHWMFRVNFVFLFCVMCVMFFMLVIFFSGLIAFAGNLDAECVRIGGNEFDAAGTAFADAFALSWTTFSTVGYGSTSPAMGHQNSNPSNCFFINAICALESLFGVLYSGFCGAVLFGKVLRIQSHAQVVFSDPILIRYGSGLVHDGDDLASVDGKTPCPVLEFRIVNRLSGEAGGEIMDATLNVVANVTANDADPNVDSMRSTNSSSNSTTSDLDTTSAMSDSHHKKSNRQKTNSDLSGMSIGRFLSMRTVRTHTSVDEDPSARLVSKQLFSKMLIEPSEHPFFKRVWLAHHILDDQSPLLKPHVQRKIRRNGGYWPDHMNSCNSIRDSLQFNQILVSMNGVSNISASNVYAQKIYDFADVSIGYQFVNLLYRETDGTLGVDLDLIDDVREQNGGGGEPLIL